MKIDSLSIDNFRAIRSLEMTNLPQTVVVAGPNGSGKSCVFDAVRLLKSAYGGYQANEWNSWFGEFNIQLDGDFRHFRPMFRDPQKPIVIAADFELSPSETDYISVHLDELLETSAREKLQRSGDRRLSQMSAAERAREVEPGIADRIMTLGAAIRNEMRQTKHRAELRLVQNANPEISSSLLLELLFSLYRPQKVGIIDYHGPTRNYGRERVDSINLNLDAAEQNLRNNALYNQSNKYQSIKAQMVAEYVRNLLAERAGTTTSDDLPMLSETLQDLFSTFFPSKKFLGPRPTPDGRLLFQVQTSSGHVHDIDELSSGEKEVLYGYLRIRNAAPRHSVLLIDEPELHLNPRLVTGLAGFYHRQLGQALGSQVWLVTHSDKLIRESVGQAGFAVYHLQPTEPDATGNQAALVQVKEDFERVVVDLVGDLAAYLPGERIVVFEGGGDSEFDVSVVTRLFPDFAAAVNCISGGGKRRVADLYGVLEQLRSNGKIRDRVFAVTDRDGESQEPLPTRQLIWDVYHIENYLLEPKFISLVLSDLNVPAKSLTETRIEESLKEFAQETVRDLVADRLRRDVNSQLVGLLHLGFPPDAADTATAMSVAIKNSFRRVEAALSSQLNDASIAQKVRDLQSQANVELNPWHQNFRGRDILRRFAGYHAPNVRYEVFRDLIVARMRDMGFQPLGMAAVLSRIIETAEPDAE